MDYPHRFKGVMVKGYWKLLSFISNSTVTYILHRIGAKQQKLYIGKNLLNLFLLQSCLKYDHFSQFMKPLFCWPLLSWKQRHLVVKAAFCFKELLPSVSRMARKKEDSQKEPISIMFCFFISDNFWLAICYRPFFTQVVYT